MAVYKTIDHFNTNPTSEWFDDNTLAAIEMAAHISFNHLTEADESDVPGKGGKDAHDSFIAHLRRELASHGWEARNRRGAALVVNEEHGILLYARSASGGVGQEGGRPNFNNSLGPAVFEVVPRRHTQMGLWNDSTHDDSASSNTVWCILFEHDIHRDRSWLELVRLEVENDQCLFADRVLLGFVSHEDSGVSGLDEHEEEIFGGDGSAVPDPEVTWKDDWKDDGESAIPDFEVTWKEEE